MLGGEYIGGGEYNSRQRRVHWYQRNISSTYEVACTTVYYIIFQATCTSCTTQEYMLGGEYIGGGEFSSRQRCVHW